MCQIGKTCCYEGKNYTFLPRKRAKIPLFLSNCLSMMPETELFEAFHRGSVSYSFREQTE